MKPTTIAILTIAWGVFGPPVFLADAAEYEQCAAKADKLLQLGGYSRWEYDEEIRVCVREDPEGRAAQMKRIEAEVQERVAACDRAVPKSRAARAGTEAALKFHACMTGE